MVSIENTYVNIMKIFHSHNIKAPLSISLSLSISTSLSIYISIYISISIYFYISISLTNIHIPKPHSLLGGGVPYPDKRLRDYSDPSLWLLLLRYTFYVMCPSDIRLNRPHLPPLTPPRPPVHPQDSTPTDTTTVYPPVPLGASMPPDRGL